MKKNQTVVLESDASFPGHELDDDTVMSTLIMIMNQERKLLKYYFKLKLTESEGKSVVRFILPLDQTRIENYDFENNYFEVPESEFNKLLNTNNR